MSIIKRESVRIDSTRSAAGAARGQACRAAAQTSARLLRANGIVRAIEVTCACGEVTVLELESEALREGAKES